MTTISEEQVLAAQQAWQLRVYEEPTFDAMRAALEAAARVAEPPGPTLDSVLAEIEAMGWCSSLTQMTREGDGWRCFAMRWLSATQRHDVIPPGDVSITGPTALGVLIALRDAIRRTTEATPDPAPERTGGAG